MQKEIVQEFNKEPDLTVTRLTKKWHISLRTLYRRWHLKTNNNSSTPKSFLDKLRLNLAQKLLRQNDQKIREIAESLKFCDEFYFSKWFKRKTGMAPREYRKRVTSRKSDCSAEACPRQKDKMLGTSPNAT